MYPKWPYSFDPKTTRRLRAALVTLCLSLIVVLLLLAAKRVVNDGGPLPQDCNRVEYEEGRSAFIDFWLSY